MTTGRRLADMDPFSGWFWVWRRSQHGLWELPRGVAFLEAGGMVALEGASWLGLACRWGPVWRLPAHAGGPEESPPMGSGRGLEGKMVPAPRFYLYSQYRSSRPSIRLPFALIFTDAFIHSYVHSVLHWFPLPCPPPSLHAPHTH